MVVLPADRRAVRREANRSTCASTTRPRVVLRSRRRVGVRLLPGRGQLGLGRASARCRGCAVPGRLTSASCCPTGQSRAVRRHELPLASPGRAPPVGWVVPRPVGWVVPCSVVWGRGFRACWLVAGLCLDRPDSAARRSAGRPPLFRAHTPIPPSDVLATGRRPIHRATRPPQTACRPQMPPGGSASDALHGRVGRMDAAGPHRIDAAELLRAVRYARRLTQRELAALAGTSRRTCPGTG